MIKNFIVDRVVRGNMYSHKTGQLLWSLNQIQNPSLSMEAESVDAVDALGTPIMTFDRSKTCTFSAENAIFDLALLAEQVGTAVAHGSIVVPAFETLDVVDGAVTLTNEPHADYPVKYIYVMENDGSLGTEYGLAAEGTATDTEFSINGKVITLPTGAKAERVFVSYDYETEATHMDNSAKNFPKAGKFVMEVLGRDVCDATTEVFAYLVLHNAKLSASTEISFDTEMTQGFELVAQQDYCSKDNLLFSLIIPCDCDEE